MVRVQLLRSWQHPNKKKPEPVGTVLQLINSKAMELLAEKRAVIYTGVYPPREKMKMKLSQLNNK